jgi:hypothetical protein
MAEPLLARGGALVLPLVTVAGGKLLLATAGPMLTLLDLPQVMIFGITRARYKVCLSAFRSWHARGLETV